MKNVRLQTARIASGKTQKQVAAEAGIPEATYQRYEYGKNEPGVRTAIRIADALDVTDLRELFAEIKPQDNHNTVCQAGGQEETQ